MVKLSEPSSGKLGPFAETTVTIIDDDEPGEIGIKEKDVKVACTEKDKSVQCLVSRFNGSSGPISCKYTTNDGSGKGDIDYVPVSGDLTFENGEVTKMIKVDIKDTGAYEKDADFTIKLSDFSGPEKSKGFASHAVDFTVKIVTDDTQKKLYDEATALMNLELEKYTVGSSSYLDQFKDVSKVLTD